MSHYAGMPLYLLCSFLPNESKWLQLVHLIIWYALVSSDCFYEMLFITLPAALQSFLYTSHHPSTRLEGLPCLRLTTDLLRPTPSEHGQTMTNHLPVGSVLLMFFSWRSRLSEQRTTWHHVTLHNMSQQFWFICALCSVGKIKCKSSNTLLIYWWHFALNPSQIENIKGANDWHQW